MATPRAGEAVVMIATGKIGIITEPLKKSGPNRGKLVAMFVGRDWEICVEPDEIEVVELIAFKSEVQP